MDLAESEDDEPRRIAEYFVVAGLPSDPQLYDLSQMYSVGEEIVNASRTAVDFTKYPEPIVDIGVVNFHQKEIVPPGYHMIDRSYTGAYKADLNGRTALYDEMYLCYRRGRDKPPITDIGVYYPRSNLRLRESVKKIETTVGGRSANVNNSTTTPMYVTYIRAPELASVDTLAVTDICIILANKGETCPPAYNKVDEGLNKNLPGHDIYLCYKKSVVKEHVLAYEPAVLYVHPGREDDKQGARDDIRDVGSFCLPWGATLEAWSEAQERPSPMFFTFVLTNEKYRRLYGGAVTFYEPYDQRLLAADQREALALDKETLDGSVRKPFMCKAICILSRWPFFDAFRKFLSFLLAQVQSGTDQMVPVERYISHFLYHVPFPTSQMPNILVQLNEDRICLQLPEETLTTTRGESFYQLLHTLDVDNIVQILMYLLTEQKILLTSLRHNTLTEIAEALIAMIFPFRWITVYVPFICLSCIHIIQSPSPYLIGVDSRFFDFFNLPDFIACVDLDTRTIKSPKMDRNIDVKMFPKKPLKVLKTSLANLRKEIQACQRDFEQFKNRPEFDEFKFTRRKGLIGIRIKECFIRFMACLLKDYRPFLIPVMVDTGNDQLFDTDGFLKTLDRSSRPLFQAIFETQVWNNFLQERSYQSAWDDSLAFFDRCIELVDCDPQGQPRLIETDKAMQSEYTKFIAPPEPTKDSEPVNYDRVFPTYLQSHLFDLPPERTVLGKGISDGQLASHRLSEGKGASLSGGLEGNAGTANETGTPALEGKKSRSYLRRWMQEIKDNHVKGIQAHQEGGRWWATHLLCSVYSLWFVTLPAYLTTQFESELFGGVMSRAVALVERLRGYQLPLADEVHYRILLMLVNQYRPTDCPIELVLNLCDINAISYGLTNQIMLEYAKEEEEAAYARSTRRAVTYDGAFEKGAGHRRASTHMDNQNPAQRLIPDKDLDTQSLHSLRTNLDPDTSRARAASAQDVFKAVTTSPDGLDSGLPSPRPRKVTDEERGPQASEAQSNTVTALNQEVIDAGFKAGGHERAASTSSGVGELSSAASVTSVGGGQVTTDRESGHGKEAVSSLDRTSIASGDNGYGTLSRPPQPETTSEAQPSGVEAAATLTEQSDWSTGTGGPDMAGENNSATGNHLKRFMDNTREQTTRSLNRAVVPVSQRRVSSTNSCRKKNLLHRRSTIIRTSLLEDSNSFHASMYDPMAGILMSSTASPPAHFEPLLAEYTNEEVVVDKSDRSHRRLSYQQVSGTSKRRNISCGSATGQLLETTHVLPICEGTAEVAVINDFVELSESVLESSTDADVADQYRNLDESESANATPVRNPPMDALSTPCSGSPLRKRSCPNSPMRTVCPGTDPLSVVAVASTKPRSKSGSEGKLLDAGSAPVATVVDGEVKKDLPKTSTPRRALKNPFSEEKSELHISYFATSKSGKTHSESKETVSSSTSSGSAHSLLDEEKKSGRLDLTLIQEVVHGLKLATGKLKQTHDQPTQNPTSGSTATRSPESDALSLSSRGSGEVLENALSSFKRTASFRGFRNVAAKSVKSVKALLSTASFEAVSGGTPRSSLPGNMRPWQLPGSPAPQSKQQQHKTTAMSMSTQSPFNGVGSAPPRTGGDSSWTGSGEGWGSQQSVDQASRVSYEEAYTNLWSQVTGNLMDPAPMVTSESRSDVTGEIHVILSSCSPCQQCGDLVYDEEIMQGWTPDESNLNTVCPFCGRSFVPRLHVRIHFLPPTQFSEAGKGMNGSVEVPLSSLTMVYQGVVHYLSPFVLRKELETVILREGEDCLRRASFLPLHDTLFWNLVWFTRRVGLPSHLPDFLLDRLRQRQEVMRADGLSHDTSKETGEARTRQALPDGFSSVLANADLVKKCPVFVHPKWDSHLICGRVGQPLYMQWSKSDSLAVNALVTARGRGSLSSDQVMRDMVKRIKENDLYGAINTLLHYRAQMPGLAATRRSLYREALFLIMSAIPAPSSIDKNAFDIAYRASYDALIRSRTQLLEVDKPPGNTATWCRRVFQDLEL